MYTDSMSGSLRVAPSVKDDRRLDVSDRLQAGVSRFHCRISHCFAYFLKIYLDYHRFLSFINYPLVTDLHLESFKNNLFE